MGPRYWLIYFIHGVYVMEYIVYVNDFFCQAMNFVFSWMRACILINLVWVQILVELQKCFGMSLQKSPAIEWQYLEYFEILNMYCHHIYIVLVQNVAPIFIWYSFKILHCTNIHILLLQGDPKVQPTNWEKYVKCSKSTKKSSESIAISSKNII